MRKPNQFGSVIGIIIIILAVVAALYFYTNSGGSDINSGADNPVVGVKVDDQDPDADPEGAETVVTPSVTVAEEPELTAIGSVKKIALFLDKNRDLAKQDEEANCQACGDRSFVLGNSQAAGAPVSGLTTVKADRNGIISDAKSADYNQIWGVSVDRSVMVPPTEYYYSDGMGEIPAPVFEITGVIAAINANVVRAHEEDGAIIYEFEMLIPAMSASTTAGNPLWVKLTPDLTKENEFYLSSGTLEATDEGYSLKVDWGRAGNVANILKLDNLEFVIL